MTNVQKTGATKPTFAVVDVPADVRPTDILIDSDPEIFPATLPCFRVDHHIDGGWTNLDSAARIEIASLAAPTPPRFVTSYLDPDAIISAGVLSVALSQNFDISQFLRSDLGKDLYSASFWCDYNTASVHFPHGAGCQLELWMRQRIEAEVGENRTDDKSHRAARDSAVFEQLANEIGAMVRSSSLSAQVLSFDHINFLLNQERVFSQFVRHDLGTNLFGVIWVVGQVGRVIPRTYNRLFGQPAIIRVVQKNASEPKKQILIGPNTSKPGWQSLNLARLGSMVAKQDPRWNLTGRRHVIGPGAKGITVEPLSELIELLRSVNLKDFQDTCPLWSVYEQTPP